MTRDPYQVLGVSPGASQEEIKRAYRQKAKECHPDLHPDDPNANQKMNEVNEAYDLLMHPEKYQSWQQQRQRPQSGGYGSYGNPYQQYGGFNPFGQQGYGGWVDLDDLFGYGARSRGFSFQPPQEMPEDSPAMRAAVQDIRAGRWADALGLLNRMTSAERTARWHYLCALAHQGAGNTMTAQQEIQRAVQMAPGNTLYRQLLEQYHQAGEVYEQRARGFNMRAMNPSRLCMGFFLANLLCNFCRCC